MADLQYVHLDTGDVVVSLESEQEPAQLAIHTQNDFVENVETPFGSVQVSVKGDVHKPAIITYPEIGMNSSNCFNSFLSDRDMEDLIPLFCWYHINSPGQEEDAETISSVDTYPTITQLAEQVEFVTLHFNLGHIIGLGVGAGANILARYALLSPDKVRGLVMINLSPGSVTWTNVSFYTSKIMSWLLKNKKLQERVKSYFVAHTLRGAQSDPDLTATYQQYFETQNPHNLALLMDSYTKRASITAVFSRQSKCRCLFIVSKDFEDYKEIEELNSKLQPKSAILQISDSGGLVLEEQPQKVAHALQLFLQGLGHAATLGIQPAKSTNEQSHLQEAKEQLRLQGVTIGNTQT